MLRLLIPNNNNDNKMLKAPNMQQQNLLVLTSVYETGENYA